MRTEYYETILGVYEGKAVCVQKSTTPCETPSQAIVPATAVNYEGQSIDTYIVYNIYGQFNKI